ncbi:MAG: phosphomannose isomerase type II C-terminal cupin domain [Cyanobacteria bacterium P01_D01_bin.73]
MVVAKVETSPLNGQVKEAPEELSLAPASATEQRPWGSFTTLEEGTGYKIKRIEVKPGHRLSLQMHHHRSEHWIVVSGTALVECGDREIMLCSNQSTYVPQCTNHRLTNPGVIPLVLIEVQNGQYLGEDDIVRFEDDYARTNK